MGFRDKVREGRAVRQEAARNWKKNIEASADENGEVDVPSLRRAREAYEEETGRLPWYAR